MKKPYITLKFAQTLDGRIAAQDGSSKWISGPQALKFAHRLRAENDAVLIGIQTVLTDDPALTVRLIKGKNPMRIVLDRRLRIPLDARLIKEANFFKTLIVTTQKAPKRKIEKLKRLGVECLILKARKGRSPDLRDVVSSIYKRGVKKLLVEGGSRIITSFLKSALADKIIVIISPKILGKAIDAVGDLGIDNIKGVLKLRFKDVKRFGEDIIYTAFIR